MYATISFSITLLGIFSIFELSKGNQKFSLLKYYILARLIIITAGSGLDYLGFNGYELPYYKEVFKILALLLTVNLFFLIVQKKIAELLNIKCNTVSTIKKSIFNKTNTSNLIELYEVYK